MNERTQRALDGEIGRVELSAQERRELASAEAVIGAALRAMPVQPLPDLAPAVLERIAQHDGTRSATGVEAQKQRIGVVRALGRSLWRPQPLSISWRPIYTLTAAAMLAFVMLVGSREDAAQVASLPRVLTQFVFTSRDARSVALAGDFTGWQPAYAMQRTGGERGVWVVVVPLEPGVHNYSFVVDGERWVPDPMAPSYDDGFGGVNSRLAVLASDAGRHQ